MATSYTVECYVCGATLVRTLKRCLSRKNVCPGECLREHRRRVGHNNVELGKGPPKMTAEWQEKAAQGRTGKGSGWIQEGYRYFMQDGRAVAEHRATMERHLGRPLGPEEIVHHIDHDTLNNRIENLRLYASRAEHFADGHPEMTDRLPKVLAAKCVECGAEFKTVTGSRRNEKCRRHRRYHRRGA